MDMDDEEHYAGERDMLYDPETGLVFLESARSFGPRIMTQYLAHFADQDTSYTMEPAADSDIAAELRRYGAFNRLEMTIDLSKWVEGGKEAGLGPVAALMDSMESLVANLSVILSAPANRSDPKTSTAIRRVVNAFSRRPDSAVTKMKAWGRESSDSPVKLIDLVQDRREHTYKLEAGQNNRRIPVGVRWKALLDCRNRYRWEKPR